MSEYLIVWTAYVNTRSGLPSHRPQAPHHAVAGGDRAADNQYGIVAPDRPQYVGPALAVERGSDWLSASGNRPQDEHFTDAVESEKQLGQQGVERCTALLYTPVGNGVSGAFGRRDARKPELAQIAGQCCLGYIPSPLEKKLPEILLAAYYPGPDYLEDRIVPFALVGH